MIIISSAFMLLSCSNEGVQSNIGNNQSKDTLIDYYQYDYSELWLCTNWGKAFQGVIGDDYQRIEIKFTSIKSQNGNKKYKVIGKSKVNNYINNFQGTIQITDIIKNTEEDKSSAEYYNGKVIGTYKFIENNNEHSSGIFEGKFSSKFLITDNNTIIADYGHYEIENLNDFRGIWTSNSNLKVKRCDWGFLPPDCSELFQRLENEIYTFNYKYIDKGWKSYVSDKSNLTFAVTDFKNPHKTHIKILSKNENEKWWK